MKEDTQNLSSVPESSVTTYSIQKTVETVETHPRKGNENTLSQTNEHIDVNGKKKITIIPVAKKVTIKF